MKKRLLFIGYSLHAKTGSVDFLIELLNEQFEVNLCLVNLMEDQPFEVLENYSGDYDSVVCVQVMPPLKILKQHISFRHAVLFPMADGCPNIKKVEKWYPYREFQIICFSEELHDNLKSAGFSAQYYQYFPKPMQFENWGENRSAFFWARREEVNCNLIRKLFEFSKIDHIHIHKVPDPGTAFTPPEPDQKLNYTFSTWFDNKDELSDKMTDSSSYIAPRIKEGIGMSFLEAMAMGRCVIAADRTTMNEYIQHGVNGLLYDPNKPIPLAEHDIRFLQENALESVRRGYESWNVAKYEMLDFIAKPATYRISKITIRMIRRAFKNPYKVIKSLWNAR